MKMTILFRSLFLGFALALFGGTALFGQAEPPAPPAVQPAAPPAQFQGELSAVMGLDLDNRTFGFGQQAHLAGAIELLPSEGPDQAPALLGLTVFFQPQLQYEGYGRTSAFVLGDASLRYGQAAGSRLVGLSGTDQYLPVTGGLTLTSTLKDVYRLDLTAASPFEYSDEDRFMGGSLAASARAVSLSAKLRLNLGPALFEGGVLSGLGYKLPQLTSAGGRIELEIPAEGGQTLVATAGGDLKTYIYIGRRLATTITGGLRLKQPGPWGQPSDLWGLERDRVFSGLSFEAGIAQTETPSTGTDPLVSLSWYQSRKSGLTPGFGHWVAVEYRKNQAGFSANRPSSLLGAEGGLEAAWNRYVGFLAVRADVEEQQAQFIGRYFLRLGGGLENLVPGLDYKLAWESNDLNGGLGVYRDRLGRLTSTFTFKF